MIDQVKFLVKDHSIVSNLFKNNVLKETKPPNRNFESFTMSGTKIRIDCRLSKLKSEIIGYHLIYINISPHYHSNGYAHNGNDLSVIRCIISIKEILNDYLGISDNDFEQLDRCNIEFVINIIPKYDTKILIENVLYQKKKEFIKKDLKHYKILNSSNNKQIKIYAKGIQCHEILNAKQIDLNTLRYEVKSKKSFQIKKYGLNTIKDLINPEKYNNLCQILINEWDYVLIVNTDFLSMDYNGMDYTFLLDCKKKDFWEETIKSDRNKYSRTFNRYYRKLNNYDNLHHYLKILIIDNLTKLKSDAFFPLENELITNNTSIYDICPN